MKSLLLYFDGLALILPKRQMEAVVNSDPILAQPLLERGLLQNFDPEFWMTGAIAKQIRSIVDSLVSDRERVRGWDKHQIGLTLVAQHFVAPSEPLGSVLRVMRKRRLITKYKGDYLVELPPYNRQAILAALALAAKASLRSVDIQPVTYDRKPIWGGYCEPLEPFLTMLTYAGMPSSSTRVLPDVDGYGPAFTIRDPAARRGYWTGCLLSGDLLQAGVDLSSVPLDEVLDFRVQHGAQFRAYARDLRRVVTDLEAATHTERINILREREEILADQAAELRAVGRSAFGRSMALALSLAGAAWTVKHGDPIAAILSSAAAVAGFSGPRSSVSAYTYLFGAHELGSRY